ncbi:MAG: hypothetical protein AB1744_03080 [Candidatus Zixiibacteriota bacterium]
MNQPLARTLLQIVALSAVPFTLAFAQTTGKLPAEKAGEIDRPQGRIAFIRDGNIWAMDAGGANPMMVCEATNADGRLSWSPDDKKIVFTRRGQVDVQGPDGGGGRHRLYDLFLASLDSAYANKPQFWFPLTGDVGNRYPEWTADPKVILFYKDVNANRVNAGEPNYQLATVEYDEKTTQPQAGYVKVLRDDWESAGDALLIMPTMGPNGEIACVAMYQQKPQGLLVLEKDEYQLPLDSIKARSRQNLNCVAPAFSHDGKWIAYVNNNLNDGSLYIMTPDFKERYQVFSPPAPTALYTVAPSFSPDSKWITFSTNDGSIWITPITGEGAQRLTGPGSDKFPAWSKTP